MALVFSPALALTASWKKPPPPAIRRALEDAAWQAVAPVPDGAQR